MKIEKKYHQTENTCPFKSYPLYDDFGDMGIGPKTSLVIDRKYTPSPLLAQQTRGFLQVCQPTNPPPSTTIPRSLEQYKKSWKIVKEKTSSNSLHFGHYKAALQDEKNVALYGRDTFPVWIFTFQMALSHQCYDSKIRR